MNGCTIENADENVSSNVSRERNRRRVTKIKNKRGVHLRINKIEL